MIPRRLGNGPRSVLLVVAFLISTVSAYAAGTREALERDGLSFASRCNEKQLESIEQDPRSHYIMVHKEGFSLDREENALNLEAFKKEYIEAILCGIDRHVSEVWNRKSALVQTPRLLLFVHGGLNPYQTGLDRIGKLLNPKDDGEKRKHLLGRSSYYPVFINWNSSFGSSWWDDNFIIRRGTRDPLGGSLTSPFALLGRLAESLLTSPREWWYQVDNAVRSIKEPRSPDEKKVDFVLDAVSYFGLLPVRGLTVPAIRGFGTPAWEMMKRRTDLLLARTLQSNGYATEGAGRTLMVALAARIPKDEDGKPLKGWWMTREGAKGPIEITLVGHSMGTMVLDRLLRAFPEVHYHRIVYLAAASSLEDFDISVLPYLTNHPYTKFWAFTLSERDETSEKLPVDVVERGSLLVWIDNLFESELTRSQRRFGRYEYYCKYYQLPKLYLSQVRVVQFQGQEGEPREHGEFDNEDKLEGILRRVDPNAYTKPTPATPGTKVNCE